MTFLSIDIFSIGIEKPAVTHGGLIHFCFLRDRDWGYDILRAWTVGTVLRLGVRFLWTLKRFRLIAFDDTKMR